MDAEYLQKNIGAALNEALTSMTIKHPEDEVEFLGRFLLKYSERKSVLEKQKKGLEGVEADLAKYEATEEEKQQSVKAHQALTSSADETYASFLEALGANNTSKMDAMQSAMDFLENSLHIPAAYLALKRVTGETETLNYVVASPSQGHVVGQQLVKVAVDPDAEDQPTRQGLSHDCLKIPEPPEEEAAEEDEDPDAPKAEKPPLVATPLIVENTMRETRCKFFGIPKLGSFVAIPFSYQSLDNENGCVLNAGGDGDDAGGDAPPPAAAEEDGGEEGAAAAAPPAPAGPSYQLARSKSEFVIGIDSIGKYRLFTAKEIEQVQAVGNKLIEAIERFEAAQGEAQLAFFNDPKLKELSDAVPDSIAKLAEEETKAMAEVAAAMEALPPPADDAEPAPGADLLRPAKESEAVIAALNKVVGDGAIAAQINLLSGYVIPLPAAANNLFYACGCLLGEAPSTFSECGSANWEKFREGLLPSFTSKINEYNPSAALSGLANENLLNNVKTYCETAAVNDPSTLPPSIPALTALSTWLQKALAAREAAIAYEAAANSLNLESQ